jgi:hypothetical protein
MIVTSSLTTMDNISAPQINGEHRRYVRYRVGKPQIRPPG